MLAGALIVYAGLMVVPGISQVGWLVVIVPFSVLMRLLSNEHHGAASGLFGFSRGVGGTLGPIVVGLAIVLVGPWLGGTHGYAAVWFGCAAALLLSLPFARVLRADERL